jgi:glutathione S-transferase
MIVYCSKINIPGLKGYVRDLRPVWLLEELGADYEARYVDMQQGEHKTPAYREIHPLGKVPALDDGDLRLFESAAICTYLADKFQAKGLIPEPRTAERARFDQWMYFATASLEPIAVQIFSARVFGDSDADLAAALEEHGEKVKAMFAVLDDHLKDKDYVMGDKLSAVDIVVATAATYAELPEMIGDFPRLQAYLTRVRARPAYEAAYRANTGFN